MRPTACEFKPVASQTMRNKAPGFNPAGGEGPKLTCQAAAENYYIAASYGATKDLYDYFKNTLGAPIRDEARTYALKLIADNP
jgi:hypothetical protein